MIGICVHVCIWWHVLYVVECGVCVHSVCMVCGYICMCAHACIPFPWEASLALPRPACMRATALYFSLSPLKPQSISHGDAWPGWHSGIEALLNTQIVPGLFLVLAASRGGKWVLPQLRNSKFTPSSHHREMRKPSALIKQPGAPHRASFFHSLVCILERKKRSTQCSMNIVTLEQGGPDFNLILAASSCWLQRMRSIHRAPQFCLLICELDKDIPC